MTDGPFRNLPLGRGWKRAANSLTKEAFGLEDSCILVEKALSDELYDQGAKQTIDSVRNVLAIGDQYTLISLGSADVENLRSVSEKTEFNATFFRYLQVEAQKGMINESSLAKTVGCTVNDMYQTRLGAVKSHSILVQHELNLKQFHAKVGELSQTINVMGVCNRLLEGAPRERSLRAFRQYGLEQGPPLP